MRSVFNILQSNSQVRVRESYVLLCLIIMILYIINPMLPYVEYALNKKYISRNLCVKRNIPENSCQGKCHLHAILEKSMERQKPDQDNDQDRVHNNKLDVHLKAEIIASRPAQTVKMDYCAFRYFLVNTYGDPIFVPPKT